jgi:hypothetical protein
MIETTLNCDNALAGSVNALTWNPCNSKYIFKAVVHRRQLEFFVYRPFLLSLLAGPYRHFIVCTIGSVK